MAHTYDCLVLSASRQLQINAYKLLWPDRCDHCKGAGIFFSTYDPSPSGVALSPGSMEEWDPCHVCLDIGRCPRCATRPLSDVMRESLVEDGFCSFCGWTSDGNATHEPPPYECNCWYELEFGDLGVTGELGEGEYAYWDIPW